MISGSRIVFVCIGLLVVNTIFHRDGWTSVLPSSTTTVGRNTLQRQRRSEKRHLAARQILSRLEPPTLITSSLDNAHKQMTPAVVNWSSLPTVVDPLGGLMATRATQTGDQVRFQRKRRQVEAFAAVLETFIAKGLVACGSTVVDFGCGTGNLVLSLAALFPSLKFVAVDMVRQSIHILRQRVQAAGLMNVKAWHGPIEDYTTDLELDVAFGLHVCGEATDRIIISAVERGIPWALAPCCIGNLNSRADENNFLAEIPLRAGERYTIEKGHAADAVAALVRQDGERFLLHAAKSIREDGRLGPFLLSFKEGKGYVLRKPSSDSPGLQFLFAGSGSDSFVAQPDIALFRRSEPQLERPRSKWLADQILADSFAELASLADGSQPEHKDFVDVFYRAKTAVTLDRAMWATERAHTVELHRIRGLDGYAKDDLLVGLPPFSASARQG